MNESPLMKKVLCFTTSFNRHKMLRGTIQDIKSQSYGNLFHSVNITSDNPKQNNDDYIKIFDDLKTEKNLFSFSKNEHQHSNYIRSITNVGDYQTYDLFVKIDDDDIYKKDYVKTIVLFFEKNDVDVISSKMKYQLNGNYFKTGDYNNLGGNPKNCDFKMPPTFAFNLKALNHLIDVKRFYGFEDHMWRDIWCENCKIGVMDNSENVIWNIHGKNISTSDFLIDKSK